MPDIRSFDADYCDFGRHRVGQSEIVDIVDNLLAILT